jgi:hypothetical protein
MNYAIFQDQHNSNSWKSLFHEDECVIFYGSIELGSKISKFAPWTPSIFCSMDNYKCSNYFPIFHGLFLNSKNYIMLPYGSILKSKNILQTFGDEIFIKPNKGNKIFPGKTIHLNNIKNELENIEKLSYYGINHDELCIIAPKHNIMTEWRFVIIDWNIVCGSEYYPNDTQQANDMEAFKAAKQLLNKAKIENFSPDPVWTLDIAKLNNGEYIPLEIGSFSCAGLYACNMLKVVEEVSQKAVDIWNDIHEI